MKYRKKKKSVITPAIKAQITEILIKILGDSIKARIARAAGAATVAAAAQICSTADQPVIPPERPSIKTQEDQVKE